MVKHKTVAEIGADQIYAQYRNNLRELCGVLKQLLKKKDVSAELRRDDSDFKAALSACKQLRSRLADVRYKDRYNGVRKAVLSFLSGSTSQRKLADLFKVTRKSVRAACEAREFNVANPSKPTLQPTRLHTSKFSGQLPDYVVDWIQRHTTPSSNTQNVVRYKEKGSAEWEETTVHWRTQSLESMFNQCLMEVPTTFKDADRSFSFNYFYSLIPTYVRKKKLQDGLCPLHHTGMALQRELKRKRNQYHAQCKCHCNFCSTEGCDHGRSPLDGDCSLFTCTRCADNKCPKEYAKTVTNWYVPIQEERKGGGLYWRDDEHKGTRKEMMKYMCEKIAKFNEHSRHVVWHKKQTAALLDNLKYGEVYVKCDFIQNLVHSRGRETTASYFGKRQTQLLSYVIMFNKKAPDGTLTKHKIFVDYLSSYLKHNSLFFQKCTTHLLTHLRDDLGVSLQKVWFDSDGGRAHFKSRITFFFASTLPEMFGGIPFHWIFSPSYHGKGECDSHGAVVKRGIKLFVLDDSNHVDDENEAVDFINTHVRNSTAYLMEIQPDDAEQDCSAVPGSNSMHEFRFFDGEGLVYSRRWPCMCVECRAGNFGDCENQDLVGEFVFCKMKRKKMRIPKSRGTGDVVVDEEGSWEVEAVVGKRYHHGRLQYMLAWKGYEERTWQYVDKLDCFELIEEFELREEMNILN